MMQPGTAAAVMPRKSLENKMPSFRTAALLAFPLALASMLAAPALADVKDGVDAWQAGNYQAAVAEWRPLAIAGDADAQFTLGRSEEHTSELQSLMRISYAVFCLKKKKTTN